MFKHSKSKHPNFAKIYNAGQNFFNEIPAVKKRRKTRKYFKFIKIVSYAIIVLAVFVFVIVGTQFFRIEEIYANAMNGKNNLEKAMNFISQKDFNDAYTFSEGAVRNFQLSKDYLADLDQSFFFSHVPYLKSQSESVGKLLDAGRILSLTANEGAVFGNNIQKIMGDNNLSFAKMDQAGKIKILSGIYDGIPQLENMKNNFSLAFADLDGVKYDGVLLPLKPQILDLKNRVKAGQDLLTEAIPAAKLLPVLAGYPDKSTFLVILQNNDELRPTGGFIGTYGILQMNNGDIARFDTHDIYHMDMPTQGELSIDPPAPIKKYLVDKWYMRDSNWSPDWPTSAQKIIWFYNQENQLLTGKNRINNFDGRFAGVIAITPNLVSSLLAITGPITIQGQTYDQNNFTNLLQYQVEKGYAKAGTPSWQRKEVIGDIVKELKTKLFDMSSDNWNNVLSVVNASLAKKDILVYLTDPDLENIIEKLNWGGEIAPSDNYDYLMVVDANMGALKTDAVMKRSIEYDVERGANGLFAKLRIYYANTGSADWKTTDYKTYTRVYVPEGSRLIKSEGNIGNVDVGTESGKTVFGAYFEVPLGKIESLYFEYKLPDGLAKDDSYRLYAQKQPGKDVKKMVVDVSLSKEVKSYSPTGFFASEPNPGEVRWETDLSADGVFRVN